MKAIRIVVATIINLALVIVVFYPAYRNNLENVFSKARSYTVISEKADSLTLKKGDYVFFGQYLCEPIMWRVLDIESDKCLLFSEYALCFKAFDARGTDFQFHNGADLERLGSSSWQDCSLRQWLNSTDEKVEYSHCPPCSNNIYKGYNAYDKEEGFLSNFSQIQLQMIHSKNGDSIFLLNQTDISRYLSTTERIKKPTANAIRINSGPYFLSTRLNVWYWTGSSISSNRTSVCTVTTSGNYYKAIACDGLTGVCPSTWLKTTGIALKSGNGKKESPYVIGAENEKQN